MNFGNDLEIYLGLENFHKIIKRLISRNFGGKFGEMGLFAVTVPEKYGGLGLKYFDHFIIYEEISRVSPTIEMNYAAHSNLSINQFVLNATEE